MQYSTPEIKRGLYEALDIYNFGSIILELWTRKWPWGDMGEMDVMEVKRSGQLPPTLTKSLPAGVGDIATKCLALNPRERPTAAHLVVLCEAAAARAMAEGPATEPPDRQGGVVARGPPRR